MDASIFWTYIDNAVARTKGTTSAVKSQTHDANVVLAAWSGKSADPAGVCEGLCRSSSSSSSLQCSGGLEENRPMSQP
eukprot:7444173-Pyramimonas_sp.AAC.1